MVYSFLIGFFGLADYAYALVGIIVGFAVIFNFRPSMPIKRFAVMLGIFLLGVLALHVYTSSAHIVGADYGGYLVACYNNTNTAGGMLFGILAFPLMKAITPVGALALVCAIAFALMFFAFFPYIKKNVTYTSEPRKVRGKSAKAPRRSESSQGEKIEPQKAPTITDFSGDGDKKLFVVDVDGEPQGKISRKAKGADGYDPLYPNKDVKIEDEARIAPANAADRYSSRGLAKDLLFSPSFDNEKYSRYNTASKPDDALSSVGAPYSAIRRTEMRNRLGIDNSDAAVREDFIKRFERKDETADDTHKTAATDNAVSAQPKQDNAPDYRTGAGRIDFIAMKQDEARLFNERYDSSVTKISDGGNPDAVKEVVKPKNQRQADVKLNETVRKAQDAVKNQNAGNVGGFTGTVARAITGEEAPKAAPQRPIESDAYERPQINVEKQEKPQVKIPRAFEDTIVKPEEIPDVPENYGSERRQGAYAPNTVSGRVEQSLMDKSSAQKLAFNEKNYDGERRSDIATGGYPPQEGNRPAAKTLGRDASVDALRESAAMKQRVQQAAKDAPPLSDAERAKAEELRAQKIRAASDRGLTKAEPRVKPAAPTAEKEKEVAPPPRPKRPYVAPSLDLLEPPEPAVSQDEDYEYKKQVLIDTLASFNIEAEVTDIMVGPTFSLYTLKVEMPKGRTIGSIVSLENDIAMKMEEESVRILAPIPGRNAVGIEVPNRKRRMVRLSEILTSPTFNKAKSPATFALGKDLYGSDYVCDIDSLPHMLIAGATGAGKSCCINSVIISLLYKASPDDVRLILVDPKRVELSVYEGIPHLLLDEIVCDADKAIRALNWAITEMSRRIEYFASLKYRNIDDYNQECEKQGLERMPRIVIIVDELADLMYTGKKAVEDSINRIARLARAVGIHLILATQRPSVDVVSGTIKNNLPSRVAFKVTAGADSRTILDSYGADKLLGNGDLLYKTPKTSTPERMQGAFISNSEVKKVVDFIKTHNESYFDNAIKDAIFKEPQEEKSEDKERKGRKKSDSIPPEVFEALRLGMEGTLITITLLQRKLGLGWPKAAKIYDIIEDMGYFEPDEKDRKKMRVVISEEEFQSLLDAEEGGEEE